VELEAPVMEEPIRPLVTQLGGLDVLEWPAMNTQLGTGITLPPETLLPPMPHTHEVSTLSGVLQGDIPAVLAQLQSDLGHAVPGQPLVIDCQRLARVDFVAAGSLLQWLLATMSQGMSVELHGVNRLVAAFFHVVGIDEAVTVRLREY
jgi:ABC-type transporter Mla MlaB component